MAMPVRWQYAAISMEVMSNGARSCASCSGARRGGPLGGVPPGDGLCHLIKGGAQEGIICVLTEVGGVLFGRVDVLGGRIEGPESAVVVGQVEVEGGVEPGDVEAGMVLLDALLGHGVGSVQGPDIPGEGLGRIFVEICQVVGE